MNDLPAEPVDPRTPTETDRLHAMVRSADDREAITSLWRRSFDLPAWYFVPSGPAGAPPAPSAAVIEGTPMLLGFTSAERARDFAETQTMIDESGAFDAIAITPREVVLNAGDYVMAGITGLVMDAHISGYFAPVTQLAPMWEHCYGEPVSGTGQVAAAQPQAVDDSVRAGH